MLSSSYTFYKIGDLSPISSLNNPTLKVLNCPLCGGRHFEKFKHNVVELVQDSTLSLDRKKDSARTFYR
jgi:hypothetical protein